MESYVSSNKTTNSWWSIPHFCTLKLTLCAPKLHLDRVTWLTIRILCALWCSPKCSRESMLASTRLKLQSYGVKVLRKHFHCTHCVKIMESLVSPRSNYQVLSVLTSLCALPYVYSDLSHSMLWVAGGNC